MESENVYGIHVTLNGGFSCGEIWNEIGLLIGVFDSHDLCHGHRIGYGVYGHGFVLGPCHEIGIDHGGLSLSGIESENDACVCDRGSGFCLCYDYDLGGFFY